MAARSPKVRRTPVYRDPITAELQLALRDALRLRSEDAAGRFRKVRNNALVWLLWECGLSQDEALALDLEQVIDRFEPLRIRHVIQIHEHQADQLLGLMAGPVAITYATEVWLLRYLEARAQRGWLPSRGPLFVGSTGQGRRKGHARLSARTARRDWAQFRNPDKTLSSRVHPRPSRLFDLEDLRIDGIVQFAGDLERKAAYARCSVEAIEGLLDAQAADFMPPPPNAGKRPDTPVHELLVPPERWAVYLPLSIDDRQREHRLDWVSKWIDDLRGKTASERALERAQGAPSKLVGCYVEETPVGAPGWDHAWSRLLSDAAVTRAFQGVVVWGYPCLGGDPATIASRILAAARAGVVVRSYRQSGTRDAPYPEDALVTEALELVAAAFFTWAQQSADLRSGA